MILHSFQLQCFLTFIITANYSTVEVEQRERDYIKANELHLRYIWLVLEKHLCEV